MNQPTEIPVAGFYEWDEHVGFLWPRTIKMKVYHEAKTFYAGKLSPKLKAFFGWKE